MASTDETSGAGDPYATYKTNLRDIIKWLAGIFSALAAVVIAGAPVSGLGAPSLSVMREAVGVLAIGICFACICTGVVLMLRLLRADLLYARDLDPRVDITTRSDSAELEFIRGDIASHLEDFIVDYSDWIAFLGAIDDANTCALDLKARYEDLANHSDPNSQKLKDLQANYDSQCEEIQRFRAVQGNILAYASYMRLYHRLQIATPKLLVLGACALLALFGFAFAVQAPKSEKPQPPTVVVVPLVAPSSAPARTSNPAKELGTVTFATNSASVTFAGMQTIEAARNTGIAEGDTALLLIARTDTVGAANVNKSLAYRRAEAVRSLLVMPGGIAASRVFVTEVPKSDLARLTGDQVDRVENRSVSLYTIPFQRPLSILTK